MVLVLWDVDQTLLDIGTVDRQVWFSLCADLVGVPVRPAAVRQGSTIRPILRSILREYGADPATAERLLPEALRREVAGVAAARPRFAEHGRVLPGVRAVVAALARTAGVVQSVLTGNQVDTARLKLAAFGLVPPLDLAAGAFGSDSEDRPALVPVARARAEAAYGADRVGPIVLVGDSRLDVETARDNGVRIVAVATGETSREALAAAGADVVLDDLADQRRALAAILGGSTGGAAVPTASPAAARPADTW
ncbi:HAD family hydrolase [Rugosimonospora africana]|uniref:Haloacid dehalogenase n=1 Tax=Rugosimonospora africana TaxID=556532 RepID=A0A8J3QSR8_9ACTN|nr:haloacid dehalogenase-like hydrolase [Rugosimonospora africana]GIH15794.1 haloacid dehalogenase [Rugosimonospora africana]